MSNIKVSQLPTAKKLSGDEHLLGVQNGESVKVGVSQIIEQAKDYTDTTFNKLLISENDTWS